MYVIRCKGYARNIPCNFVDQYLEWFNPNGDHLEWYDPNGSGSGLGGWTPDINKAMVFDSVSSAVEKWKEQRTVDGGFRYDGQPDRPLTAFSIEILEKL